MFKLVCFAFLLLSTLSEVFAQQILQINEEGIPPVTHYTSKVYQGNDQVWDIIQDDKGLIYITTTSSLNEYDGETWRSIPIKAGQIGMSFTKTENNRIYVCGWDMLGYLAVDSTGSLGFQSLKEQLPSDFQFGIVGFTESYGSKIAFSGSQSILIYDEETNEFTSNNTDELSIVNFSIDKEIIFHIKGKGLVKLQSDTLVAIEGGAYFKDIVVSDVVNIDESAVVFSTYYQGFYYYSNDTTYEISALNLPYYKSKYPKSLFKISDAYYGMTLLQDGLIIVDKYWKPIIHLNKSNGFTSEAYSGFVDASNNIWLGTNEGLYRVDISSAHSIIDTRLGVDGNVLDVKIINEDIYVASSQGIYTRPLHPSARDEKNLLNKGFVKVKQSQLYNDLMLGGKEQILTKAGGTVGVIQGDEYKVLLRQQSDQAYAITYLQDSSFAITSGKNGKYIELFGYINNQWRHQRTLYADSLPDIVLRLIYDLKSNRIWGANQQEVFSFNLNASLDSVIDFNRYSTMEGLPANDQNKLQWIDSEIGFGTVDGFYRFDSGSEQFVKSTLFHDLFDDSGLVTLSKESDSVYWYSMGNYKKGKVTISSQSLATLDSGICKVLEGNNSWIEYVEGFGSLIAGSTGLYFIPKGKIGNSKFDFDPMVRRVELISDGDSIIFSGEHVGVGSIGEVPKPIILKPNMNALRFAVSIPFYQYSDKNLYAFKLEPFDQNWTSWTDLNQKEYTNLSPGKYTFVVKARNAYLEESDVASFAFVIETPWHETIWMYGLYFLLFVGLVYLIVDWNSQRLRKENLKLEGIIEERTAEIRDQKEVIEKVLKERESLLKEIHHRVKNNLQIIASLLYLQSGKFENEDFKRVLEEGQGRVRSMALIHQKLYENDDLKSIPFGEYLQELLGEIKASFGQTTEKIVVEVDSDNIQFDVETAIPLGLIVNELATNAFKYAFSGLDKGTFSISLKKENGQIVLNVSDDGKGIPDGIDIKKTKSLGLRLVKMLSVQLEGDYSFQSEKGTNFKLKFAA